MLLKNYSCLQRQKSKQPLSFLNSLQFLVKWNEATFFPKDYSAVLYDETQNTLCWEQTT